MNWREFFSDAHGRLSSKRLAGIVAALTLDAVLMAQTLAAIAVAWHHPELPSIPLDTQVVWGCVAVALGGLGLTSLEKHFEHKTEQERTRATTAMRAIPEDRP